MSRKKIKFSYNPDYNSDSNSNYNPDSDSNRNSKRKYPRGIKDTFVNTDYTGLNNNSEVDTISDSGPGNEIIGATSLQELDLIENTDNIYVDPFKPLFLAPSVKKEATITPKPKRNLDLTISQFLQKISDSFVDILNDLLDNNYDSISDLLLRNDRGIAVAILLIFISLFLIFFTS